MKGLYLSCLTLGCYVGATALLAPINAQEKNLYLGVVVNSSLDGAIQPDAVLTLREAIALANGTLPLESLSSPERNQVSRFRGATPSQIYFQLPAGETTIRLVDELPPLATPGLVIDGTTQPGYKRNPPLSPTPPRPVVAIAPAEGAEVFRGLTVIADSVVIRGLSLYGFTAKHRATEVTLPADIFIAARLPVPDPGKAPANVFPFVRGNTPPKDVVIENNWLGVPPSGNIPPTLSAFGVYVFDSLGTTIRQNWIASHDGSGIITSVRAENLRVNDNIISGNGFAGMPDAVRLEGIINNSQVGKNTICENAGSGVFLFKPEGAVEIRDNQIQFNGRRLSRAAVYLMGHEHKVINNQIGNQNGPGVVVASYPQSDRNIIQNNKFAALDGLSIDLNAQHNVGVEDFQQGDGPNPPRNSPNRRRDTGNAAINAPQFLAREFFVLNGKVNLDGIADAGSQVEVYRTRGNDDAYNPLSELLATVETDAKGRFSVSLRNLQPGERVSAIATDPKYGTSEPALNALVKSLDGTLNPRAASPLQVIPQCAIPSPTAELPQLKLVARQR